MPDGIARSRAASRASGATTTPARPRSTCSGWPPDEPYLTFFGPEARPMTRSRRRARHRRHARHRAGHRPRRWRATAGRSRSAACAPAADVAATSSRARAPPARPRSPTGPPTSAWPPTARGCSTPIATRFARLDALVNNAGKAPRVRADLLEADEESFEDLIRTNLQGPYFLTQQAARLMLERRGKAEAPPSRRHRLRDVGLGRTRLAQSRRVLRQQGRAGDGRPAVRGAAGAAWAFRSTKCGPASSPPT